MTPQLCPLPDYGFIEVRGTDAAAFLQGQLSRTVTALDGSSAPLAGWHDARGRVRALFRVLRLGDRWLLGTPRDGVEHTAGRLKMFVLRAAVTLRVADDVRAATLVDADTPWLDGHGLPADAARNALAQRASLDWIHLGAGVWQAVGPSSALDGFEPTLARGSAALADLAEIRLGIPAIGAPLAERYVAQMLNLDQLDALSFDKGCYPGQEVIARVHHLGAVKRRLRRYASDSEVVPAVGAELVAAGAQGQPVGEIVRAAAAPLGFEALAVIEEAAVGPTLSVAGATLREQPLA